MFVSLRVWLRLWENAHLSEHLSVICLEIIVLCVCVHLPKYRKLFAA